MLLGAARSSLQQFRKTVEVTQQLTLLAPITDGPADLDWSQATPIDLPVEDLESEPEADAQFAEVPAQATKQRATRRGAKISRAGFIEISVSNYSRVRVWISSRIPAKRKRDFRVRLQQIAREQRDEAVEKLRRKYAPKFEQLEDRKRRAEQAVARETEQAKGQKMQTAISFGATLLSSLFRSKASELSTLGRATTAVRGVSRSMKETEDVDRAEGERRGIVAEARGSGSRVSVRNRERSERSFDPQTEQLETVSLKPTKANIAVKLLTLAWAPYWHERRED